MKVRIIKPCIDGLTHEALRVGDIVEMTEDRLKHAPVGYVEVIEGAREYRTAENAEVKTRKKRTPRK